MAGKRCAMGCETWPNSALYNTCPVCGEATRFINREPSLTPEAASSIRLHALFEEFYEKRCTEQGIPADGPWPSDAVIA